MRGAAAQSKDTEKPPAETAAQDCSCAGVRQRCLMGAGQARRNKKAIRWPPPASPDCVFHGRRGATRRPSAGPRRPRRPATRRAGGGRRGGKGGSGRGSRGSTSGWRTRWSTWRRTHTGGARRQPETDMHACSHARTHTYIRARARSQKHSSRSLSLSLSLALSLSLSLSLHCTALRARTHTRTRRYETVTALSVSKWVHLNHGDAGIRALFRRAHSLLQARHPRLPQSPLLHGYTSARVTGNGRRLAQSPPAACPSRPPPRVAGSGGGVGGAVAKRMHMNRCGALSAGAAVAPLLPCPYRPQHAASPLPLLTHREREGVAHPPASRAALPLLPRLPLPPPSPARARAPAVHPPQPRQVAVCAVLSPPQPPWAAPPSGAVAAQPASRRPVPCTSRAPPRTLSPRTRLVQGT